MVALALPALPAIGTFLMANPIGQAITGTAVGGALMAGLPQLQKSLDKNQEWTFDPNADDPDKAVRKLNKATGETTYTRLGGEEMKHLFGGLEGYRAYAERRAARANSKELKDSLMQMYGQGQKRQDAMLALQIENSRANQELQRLTLLQGERRAQADDAYRREALASQDRQHGDRMALEREQFGENKNQAFYANVRGAVDSRNNVAMTKYNIDKENAQNAYLNELDQHNDEDRRRSLPALGLIKAGEFLMLGRR